MNSIWSKRTPPAHPDWILDACGSLSRVAGLYAQRRIPGSIETPMIVVPVKRILRGVYGSDLKAALALLGMALAALPEQMHGALMRFWKFRILRQPEPTRAELLALLEADDDEDDE